MMKQIPIFPLNLLPLPDELVPLHIFEPRYKELIMDAEANDIAFGIYLSDEINTKKIGSCVKLESLIKRYPGGESDIIVKCVDIFQVENMYRTYPGKLYAGADVHFHMIEKATSPSIVLEELFLRFLSLKKANERFSSPMLYQLANELDLDIHERYALLTAPDERKEKPLISRLRFLIHLLNQEQMSRDVFHLN